jgi:DNA-binding CsgD family transcriptional regulator
MLSWEEILQNYIIKHSDKIRGVTRTLRERFQIQYFTYHRIDRTGKYTVLVDRPDWAEHYVEEKFYLEDPYLRHPDFYQPGFCLIENHGSEEHKQRVLKDGKELFNLDQGVILIEKNRDSSVEFFGFSGNKASSSLDQLYLNHPWVLKSFARYFKKELKLELLQMEEEAGVLDHLKGSGFYSDPFIQPDVPSEEILNYLKDLGKESEVIKAGLLSNREKQCIQCLLKGKSAKETAIFLGLSHRTIEFYFENIKNKLSCNSKQEIFSLGKDFEELGLL